MLAFGTVFCWTNSFSMQSLQSIKKYTLPHCNNEKRRKYIKKFLTKKTTFSTNVIFGKCNCYWFYQPLLVPIEGTKRRGILFNDFWRKQTTEKRLMHRVRLIVLVKEVFVV